MVLATRSLPSGIGWYWQGEGCRVGSGGIGNVIPTECYRVVLATRSLPSGIGWYWQREPAGWYWQRILCRWQRKRVRSQVLLATSIRKCSSKDNSANRNGMRIWHDNTVDRASAMGRYDAYSHVRTADEIVCRHDIPFATTRMVDDMRLGMIHEWYPGNHMSAAR